MATEKRVLLLIAHNAFREAVAMMLDEEPDFEVVLQAGSLAELGNVDLDHNVDIALVAPALSDGDGMTVVREVSSSDTDAVALVLTTTRDSRLAERSSEVGAVRVLDTSSTLDEILEAIRSTTSRSARG